MSTNATFDQAKHLLTVVSEKGTPREQITALVERGFFSDLLDANVEQVNREELRKVLGLTPLQLKILLDYGDKKKPRTLAEMIAAGHYDWTNDDITAERFPIVGEGQHQLVPQFIHFNRVISSDEVERELDKMKLRPGKIEELLTVGETYPDIQRKFPVAALGSVAGVRGPREVAALGGVGAGRDLGLDWWGDDWGGRVRFLAFAK